MKAFCHCPGLACGLRGLGTPTAGTDFFFEDFLFFLSRHPKIPRCIFIYSSCQKKGYQFRADTLKVYI